MRSTDPKRIADARRNDAHRAKWRRTASFDAITQQHEAELIMDRERAYEVQDDLTAEGYVCPRCGGPAPKTEPQCRSCNREVGADPGWDWSRTTFDDSMMPGRVDPNAGIAPWDADHVPHESDDGIAWPHSMVDMPGAEVLLDDERGDAPDSRSLAYELPPSFAREPYSGRSIATVRIEARKPQWGIKLRCVRCGRAWYTKLAHEHGGCPRGANTPGACGGSARSVSRKLYGTATAIKRPLWY